MFIWIKGHKFLSLLLAIFITLSLIVTSSSYITIWGIKSFLSDHASDISIQKLKLSLWQSDLLIEGFEAYDQQGKKIAFEQLYMDWENSDLWDNKLTVHAIGLQGLKLDVAADNFSVTQIGPIVLAKLQSSEPEETVTEQSKPWSLSINDTEIINSEICYLDTTKDFSSVGVPLTNNSKLEICLSISSLAVADAIELSPTQELSYQGRFALDNLDILLANKQSLTSLDKFAIQQVSFSGAEIGLTNLNLTQLQLLSAQDKDISDFGSELQSLTVERLNFNTKTQQLTVHQTGLSELAALLRASDQQLHSVAQLEALSLEYFSLAANQPELKNLALNNLKLLENFEDEDLDTGFLVTTGLMQLSDLSQQESELSVGTVELNNVMAFLKAHEQGINTSTWFSTAKESSDAATESDTEQAQDLNKQRYNLSELKLGNESSIVFIDNSMDNAVGHQISDINLSIGELAYGNAEAKPTAVSYSMKIGESGELSGAGNILLNESVSVDIKGSMTTINMVDYTHYASRFVGHRIDQGHLHLDYNIKIVENKIDSKFETRFDKFELGSLQDHEQSDLNEELGVPLPLALNLLRDSDDNIELDFPVTGDLDSPEFSFTSIISVVTIKAIKNAVIYNYSPLGMLSLASGVFDLATALKFEPVIFEATKTELTEQGKSRLHKVIAIMQEKPRIKMVVCGVATHQDIMVVDTPQPVALQTAQPETKQDPKSEVVIDPIPLLEIAKLRQQIVIDYISSEGKIEKARLLGCNVKLNKGPKAKPAVNLSI